MQKKVGITTTVPIEVIYAANMVPVDLNNLFIKSDEPQKLIEEAELRGYPRNICAWIKGIYAVMLKQRDIDTLIVVTQGDCSNTHALMETLELEGIRVIPFAYSFDRDYDLLKLQLDKLICALGTTWGVVKKVKAQLDEVREIVWKLDELTWRENCISGWDNHLYQVSCSDFNGNPEKFKQTVEEYILNVNKKQELKNSLRLGYIGVPPIFYDLYQYLEARGARVVYNEVQRQFTMPFDTKDIVEQYRLYTYPYGIFYRLKDIKEQIKLRKLDGIIHYVQSFCYRQIEDLIIRRKIELPIITLEGDRPGKLDARTKMRIDAFLEMLR
ncbi:2-hydroxyacyl-CoA dehydratase [Peptococcaceae bacterium]|nr:2-hydroxyacyl-CoA dehydratase [Peptococcaceae bacterium]